VKPKEIPMTQSPVLLHVWSVRPEQGDALVARLAEMFGHVTNAPGFVSARILASADRTSVAAVVERRVAALRRLGQRRSAAPRRGEAMTLTFELAAPPHEVFRPADRFTAWFTGASASSSVRSWPTS
jgi:hypothetical protein